MSGPLAARDHETFVARILSVMGRAAEQSGARNVRQRIDCAVNGCPADGIAASEDPVLDARFALGADNGAYLRSNVMPLQSVTADEGELASSRLLPQLEVAGRMGVLDALDQRLQQERRSRMADLSEVFGLCAYLLTMPEVNEFVTAQLEAELNTDGVDLVKALHPKSTKPTGPSRTNFARTGTAEEITLRCRIVKVMLLIFGKPMDTMREQWDTTLGPNGTGTVELQTAIERLALSARNVEATWDANKALVRPAGAAAASAEPAANAPALPTPSPLPPPTIVPTGSRVGQELASSSDESDYQEALEDREAVLGALMRSLNRATTRAGGPSGEAPTPESAPPFPAPPPLGPVPASTEQPDLRGDAPPAPPTLVASAGPVPTGSETDGFCRDTTLDYSDSAQETIVKDALCAGITQLREDGGWPGSWKPSLAFVRQAGVSPFWRQKRERTVGPRTENDSWDTLLWPRGAAENFVDDLEELQDRLDNTSLTDPVSVDVSGRFQSYDTSALSYCMVRGLCGQRAPHHAVPDETAAHYTLRYNKPLVEFPTRLATTFENPVTHAVKTDVTQREATDAALIFGPAVIKPVPDFVDSERAVKAPVADKPRVCKWAPVKPAGNKTWVMQKNPQYAALGAAVVYEHLVDHYNLVARFPVNEWERKLALACRAAAKISQLEDLTVMYSYGKLQALAPPFPRTVPETYHLFVTRPVLRCPDTGDGSSVLYPCDAGLWSAVREPGGKAPEAVTQRDPIDAKSAYGSAVDVLAASTAEGFQEGHTNRKRVLRRDLTPYLRAAIRHKGLQDAETIPLYIAAPPGVGQEVAMDNNFGRDPPPLDDPGAANVFPKDATKIANVEVIATVLRRGIVICKEMEKFKCEEEYIARMRKEESAESAKAGRPQDVDELSRVRREAVWTDAEREAAIAGDRLYSFVRQLSGTISENVDAVCQIDEGLLIRQQQQARERRARISDRAAQEHMQLVRGVFTAVLRESGLALGFGTADDPGQLKVVSNSLRKQATELTQQGGASEGFFSNAVRLEKLLQSGTGEVTLTELFTKLREAGVAMQEAAMASQPVDGLPGSSASLDFLSTPRNSLVLRYKPEALAAIRSAFDLFQREMLVRHGRMYRTITAYELIEGNDEALCTAFASFAAHNLVHSRMYSSATAMYVAAWPAAANAQQMKISLHRLTHLACDYLSATSSPAFLSTEGRTNYFSMARSRH